MHLRALALFVVCGSASACLIDFGAYNPVPGTGGGIAAGASGPGGGGGASNGGAASGGAANGGAASGGAANGGAATSGGAPTEGGGGATTEGGGGQGSTVELTQLAFDPFSQADENCQVATGLV